MCIPAAILSPYLFSLVFGPKWEVAGKITQILSLFQLSQFTVGPVMQILLIIGMRKAQLMVDLVRFLSVILSFYITSFSNKGVIFAITVYVLVASVNYGLNYIYISILLSKVSIHANKN